MRAYYAIFKCRLSTLFQYRLAALAGLSTQIFWGIVKIMILKAFYEHAVSPQPISLMQAITFIWLGQALLQILPWNLEKEIEGLIKTGNVAYELVRPLNLYWLWFYRCMALRLIPTVMRSTPLFVIAITFFELSPPVSWAATGLFGISLVCALFLSAAITTLVMISLFWTISGEGIQRMLPHVNSLLAGMLVPLPLFPDWMQPFLNAQPLRGILDIPTRIYTGIIPAHEAIYYFGFQLGWTLAFIILGKWAMQKALRHVVIQGG